MPCESGCVEVAWYLGIHDEYGWEIEHECPICTNCKQCLEKIEKCYSMGKDLTEFLEELGDDDSDAGIQEHMIKAYKLWKKHANTIHEALGDHLEPATTMLGQHASRHLSDCAHNHVHHASKHAADSAADFAHQHGHHASKAAESAADYAHQHGHHAQEQVGNFLLLLLRTCAFVMTEDHEYLRD